FGEACGLVGGCVALGRPRRGVVQLAAQSLGLGAGGLGLGGVAGPGLLQLLLQPHGLYGQLVAGVDGLGPLPAGPLPPPPPPPPPPRARFAPRGRAAPAAAAGRPRARRSSSSRRATSCAAASSRVGAGTAAGAGWDGASARKGC